MPAKHRTLSRILVFLVLWLGASSVRVSAQEIIEAVKRQDLAAVQRLLRENPRAVAARYSDGAVPLHFAALVGNLPIMELLFRYRADVNARQRDGWTPLHSAAVTNQVGAMRALLEHGADLDARTNDGNEAIHVAAKFDQAPAVNFLLSHGVNVDTPNGDGNTALAVAAAYGKVSTGRFLLSAGSHVQIENRFQKTALDEALRANQGDLARILTEYQQALGERAAREILRKSSGLNLRAAFADWANPKTLTRMVYTSDFKADTPGPEWNTIPLGGNSGPLRISTTPSGGRRFLGEFGTQAVLLTLKDLPSHNEIAISFDLFIIRTMDGSDGNSPNGPDVWTLSVVDGPSLIQTTFANGTDETDPHTNFQSYPGEYPGDGHYEYTGAVEHNTLGYTFHLNNRDIPMSSVYRLRYTFTHSNRIILFRFAGTNMQALDDESWGITNVKVAVAVAQETVGTVAPKVPPAPEPAMHPIPRRAIAVRRAASKPKASPVVRHAKPASKPKPAPEVGRLHSKKVAPKP